MRGFKPWGTDPLWQRWRWHVITFMAKLLLADPHPLPPLHVEPPWDIDPHSEFQPEHDYSRIGGVGD